MIRQAPRGPMQPIVRFRKKGLLFRRIARVGVSHETVRHLLQVRMWLPKCDMATQAIRQSDVCSDLIEDAPQVGGAVNKHPVRRDIPRECMS